MWDIRNANDISNVDIYKSSNIEISYNISKLQILSAVEVLNHLGEEATTDAICGLICRPMSSVTKLTHRYTQSGLLSRKARKERSRLVRGSVFAYKLTKKGLL